MSSAPRRGTRLPPSGLRDASLSQIFDRRETEHVRGRPIHSEEIVRLLSAPNGQPGRLSRVIIRPQALPDSRRRTALSCWTRPFRPPVSQRRGSTPRFQRSAVRSFPRLGKVEVARSGTPGSGGPSCHTPFERALSLWTRTITTSGTSAGRERRSSGGLTPHRRPAAARSPPSRPCIRPARAGPPPRASTR